MFPIHIHRGKEGEKDVLFLEGKVTSYGIQPRTCKTPECILLYFLQHKHILSLRVTKEDTWMWLEESLGPQPNVPPLTTATIWSVHLSQALSYE